MRKRFITLLCVCCLCFSGCRQDVVSMQNSTDKSSVSSSDQDNPKQMEDEKDETENTYELTEMDLKRLQLKLETIEGVYNEYAEATEYYQAVIAYDPNAVNYDELIQNRIVSCYEENVALALEMKTLLVESVGVEVPGVDTGNTMTEEWISYVKDNVKDVVQNSVASPEVVEAVQNGFSFAMETYENNNSVEGMLVDVKDAVANGVTAKIENTFYEKTKEVMSETTGGLSDIATGVLEAGSVEDYIQNQVDEKTGGILGTVNDISNFDSTTPVYLNKMSESAQAASNNMFSFLEKEKVNSEDIMEVMYQYSQYGNTMSVLSAYGITGTFDWQSYYEKMNAIYKEFVNNEIMIAKLQERLEQGGEIRDFTKKSESSNENSEDEIEYAQELKESIEKYESVLSSANPENEFYEEYANNLQKLKEYQEGFDLYYSTKAQYRKKFNEMPDYTEQTIDLKNQIINTLLRYKVENFEVEYDYNTMEWIEKNNKLNYAIGEFAKRTPWGVSVNFLTSLTIDDNSRYFNSIVEANNNISEAYGPALERVSNSLERVRATLEYYERMTEGGDPQKYYENFALLCYIQQGEDINIDDVLYDAYKDLYVYALEMEVAGDIFDTISSSSDGSSYYNQSRQAMELVEKSGYKEQIQSELTSEDYQDLLTIYQAARQAIAKIESVSETGSMYKDYFVMHAGRIGRDFWDGGAEIHRCVIGQYAVNTRAEGSIVMDIYSLKNRPFYINGVYIHHDQVLYSENEKPIDGKVVAEEANWIIRQNAETDEWYTHFVSMMKEMGMRY